MPKYKIVAYRRGIEMRTDHCDNWLEAEELVSEILRMTTLYDEVRMIRLEEQAK